MKYVYEASVSQWLKSTTNTAELVLSCLCITCYANCQTLETFAKSFYWGDIKIQLKDLCWQIQQWFFFLSFCLARHVLYYLLLYWSAVVAVRHVGLPCLRCQCIHTCSWRVVVASNACLSNLKLGTFPLSAFQSRLQSDFQTITHNCADTDWVMQHSPALTYGGCLFLLIMAQL